MGFIDALYTLGKEFSSTTNEISDYLSLPATIGKTKEIRIYLKLENYEQLESNTIGEKLEPLKISGISKIDEADFFAGNGTEEEKKMKYLYKEPPGSNTSWRYSPVLRISKPKVDREKNSKAFSEGSKSYFTKIEKMFMDMEEMNYFEKGTVEKLMEELNNNLDKILACYTDKNSNYLIVFGIDNNSNFLYPGEIPHFRNYFNEKLNNELDKKQVNSTKNSSKCNYCGNTSDILVNFNLVFPFATFDKPNFLPAINEKFSHKIYKICDDCLKTFTRSKSYVEFNLSDDSTIYKIQIWIIPEFFTIDKNVFDMSFKKLNNYISSDQHSKEESLLDYITDPNYIEDPYTAVFHFLFLEQNQSQLIIHQMIEDVPLTRIRKLQKIWENTVQNFENTKSINNKLSTAFKQIHSSLRRLVLKEKDEIQVMRNLSIDIIGKLLSGEKIDTKILKQNFVARIPKLMNDKTQSDRFYFILNDFLIINEFLTNYNKSLGVLV